MSQPLGCETLELNETEPPKQIHSSLKSSLFLLDS